MTSEAISLLGVMLDTEVDDRLYVSNFPVKKMLKKLGVSATVARNYLGVCRLFQRRDRPPDWGVSELYPQSAVKYGNRQPVIYVCLTLK